MATSVAEIESRNGLEAAAGGEDVHVRVAIVGSGFTGLAMVHALRKAGTEDFLVLERSAGVGGVWRSNTYPGIACDVPSHLYSLSFAPNPDWERTFSSGGQIWDYEEQVARDLRMAERTWFGEALVDARWDAARAHWRLRTTTRQLTAQFVVDGSGVLAEPKLPAIEGIERFKGALFHSARWNHDEDLAGKRVAVIGTGASAIQIVPAIQPQVAHMTVFQRTPGWVIPRNDRDITDAERRALRRFPVLQKLIRGWQWAYRDAVLLQVMHRPAWRRFFEAVSKAYMRATIDDPALRAKLTPDFEIGCKRILITSAWYPALNQPNVDVETTPIAEVREHAVVTADGVEHPVDAIVCATGFHVTDPPAGEIFHGRDGRSLAETWGASPRAYRGVTTANFPNLFRIGSIGTGTGHFSHIAQIESAITYVMDALRVADARGLAAVEVSEDAQEQYARRLHAMVKDTVWAIGGCSSWYLDASGEPSAVWPGSGWMYRKWTRRFDVEAYAVTPRALVAAPAPAPMAGSVR
ncbi:MAG TPA: NAD(P)/FAD-dependent oxidoreductase [Solirubrobacteraceae bacterium]|nr:NAD(P)/FAD-dependent oxidoreductase [Solirubrobacteraceae bacterium]